MKRLFLLTLIINCQLSILSLAAQPKAEQIKHIRQIYAEAKQKVAKNGKNGSVPLELNITRIENDPIVEAEENVETRFFFERPDYGKAVCYLITYNRDVDGHTEYRELLFDPIKGHLLFSFMKAETHAGFKVETRYYYDATGRCIEQTHKVQDQPTTAEAHTWSNEVADKEMAANYINIFNGFLNTYSYPDIALKGTKESVPKDEIIKRIRTIYSQAKDKSALNDKKDGTKNEVVININDQAEPNMPPITQTLKFYYEIELKSDTFRHCYFLSEKSKSMYAQTYEEYLTDNDIEHHNLIFNYCNSDGEGENLESRYYYDSSGHCIESKCNLPDYDERDATRNRAAFYFSLFTSIFR